jgi:hypothetical protein
MTAKRLYKVHVSEVRRFWGVVTVEAESEEEAEEDAREEFCPCWVESECLKSYARVLIEEGQRVTGSRCETRITVKRISKD